ncbi:MAG: SemiSWEET transporter [Candidatus Thermoplasmatota archaeon]|nr:SemiSWEET transporter [Candidatus Thermoplasmatota archaeon]
MMDATFLELFGLLAGAITSISFIPQLYKGYATKKLDDVSYFMFLILASGMALWVIYGTLKSSLAIIITNSFGIACSFVIVLMKKRYS